MQAAQTNTPPHANNNGPALRSSEGATCPAKPKGRSGKHGWTPERRSAQAEAIRRWKPWAKSTGPKTKAGKARAAQNAAKPHLRRDPDRVVQKALDDHGRYLTDFHRLLSMRKYLGKNKLLDRRIKYREKVLLKRGMEISARLYLAAIYAGAAPVLSAREISPDYAKILLFGGD